MNTDQEYERTTKIVISNDIKTDVDIRMFLNKLCNTHEFFEYEEHIKYYYCHDEISKKVYDRMIINNINRGLSYCIYLNHKRGVKQNLLFVMNEFYIKYGYCSVNFTNNIITINNCTGVYISVMSTESDKDILKNEHVNRVKYILNLFSKLDFDYAYECRTLSDTHITMDEECEI